MARAIKQFRYYGKDNPKNQPSSEKNSNSFENGTIFFKDAGLISIVQLGIQTLPGTKFYINDAVDPIIIGSTGIYELDLKGLTDITSLSFESASLSRIEQIDSAYLIVDAIYEIEED